ncbi:MAG: SPFH domain-containing protein [Phycisphaerales bacterium]|nr:MAG: SPFH domain-containing protein [Phycisphaerales bacterium]
MRTLLLACLLGIAAFVIGLTIFGEIDDQKIRFDKPTLEKIDSLEEAWLAARSQPLNVYVCGGVGILVGGLAGVGLGLVRRSRKAGATDAGGLSRHEAVPAKPEAKSVATDLERLEAERPFVCKLFGLLTLGICKFYAVPQGKALVVTAFGKYRKACEPGLGCILSLWGLYQHPCRDIPLIPWKEYAIPYENEAVATSDGATCRLSIMVCYRIVDAGKALFEVDDYEQAMGNMIRTVLRRECARESAQTLRASRSQMAGTLRDALEKDVAPWGINVRLVDITDIDIPAQ